MTESTTIDVRPKRTALRRALPAWFRRNARDLPWRRTRDPYRIWLSEVMLQQTRVDTVLPYYRRFLRAFPKVNDLAAASQDEVLKLWEGLGYYRRARALHDTAKVIVAQHAGRMPRTAAELRELPGVGRYTAGAIASIAYDEPVALLEGNVKRVLARVFAIEASIDDTATVAAMWDAVDALVPRREPGTFNQALMELGSRVCTPRNPQCDTCPVRKWCDAAAQDRAADLPVRRPKKKLAHHQIVAGVLRRNGRYLLGKRRPEGMLGGLWEFPGGKVEPGESHEQALRRELREELGIDTRVGARLASVDHAYTHFKITLNLYTCEHVAGEVAPRYHTELKWVRRRDFDRYAFPAANLKCFDHV